MCIRDSYYSFYLQATLVLHKKQIPFISVSYTHLDVYKRQALGLDDPGNGREAFHALVLSDGTRALILQDHNGKLVLGFGKPKSEIFKSKDSLNFVGIKYFDKKDNLIWEQKMDQ